MRLRVIGWSALIVLPLLIGAGHVHMRRTSGPETMKEVNRCLSIVRVAAARRRRRLHDSDRQRHGTAGVVIAAASTPQPDTHLQRIA